MGQSVEQPSVQPGSLLSVQTRLPVKTVVSSHLYSNSDNITTLRDVAKTKYESRKLFVGPTLDDNTTPQKPLCGSLSTKNKKERNAMCPSE